MPNYCNTIFKPPRRGVSHPKELHFRCLAPAENEFQQGWFGLTVNLSKSFHLYMKSKRSGTDTNSSPDHQKQHYNRKKHIVKRIPTKKAKKINFSSAHENEQALIGRRRSHGLQDTLWFDRAKKSVSHPSGRRPSVSPFFISSDSTSIPRCPEPAPSPAEGTGLSGIQGLALQTSGPGPVIGSIRLRSEPALSESERDKRESSR